MLAAALRLHWLCAYLFMLNGLFFVVGSVMGGDPTTTHSPEARDGREKMILGMESELDKDIKQIEDDFQKLPSFKCQKKLIVFSSVQPEDVRKMAESYLERFSQHVAARNTT